MKISLIPILILLAIHQAAAAPDPFSRSDVNSPGFFPILPWGPLRGWDGQAADWKLNGLESISQCGFNMAGFVTPTDLRQCRKLKLGAILLPDSSVVPLKYQREWRRLSGDEIDRRIRDLVKAGGSTPALKGYFIMDEPGVADFPALRKAVAALKRYAPGKLAYINLFPNYATLGAPDRSQLGTTSYAEYLERFILEVEPQLLSYDNYMVQYSDDFENARLAAIYFENLMEVWRAGRKHHLPCLQIVAANQLRPGHSVASPANLALQAYTTLAAGFRGVTWYTYYGRHYACAPVDDGGQKTLTWMYLREINRQVNVLAPALSRLHSRGLYFTPAPPGENLPQLPGEYVESVESTTPMMIGEFADEGSCPYVMLVNLSLSRSGHFTLRTKQPPRSWQEISAVDGVLRPFTPRKDGTWLPAGQGILLQATR